MFIPTLTRGSAAQAPVIASAAPAPVSGTIADDLFDEDDEASAAVVDLAGPQATEVYGEPEETEEPEFYEEAEVFEEAEVLEDDEVLVEAVEAVEAVEVEPVPPTPPSPPSPPAPPPTPPTPRSPPPLRTEGRPPPPVPEVPAKAPRKPPGRSSGKSSGKSAGKSAGKGSPWHLEVFGDHYAQTLPRDSESSADVEVAFMIESAKLRPTHSVLDVGCGGGRHLFAFAKAGFEELTGLDTSLAELVRGARQNLAEAAGITFLHGDMRELPGDQTYDVVTCLGSTLGYFDDEQNRACLKGLVDRLNPGGTLILQVLNRDHLMGIAPCRSWWQGRGCLVLDVAEMNFFTSRLAVHRTIVFEDGRQFEHRISMRTYSVEELGRMIAGLGLRTLEVSGSHATPGRFFGASSPDIWICAQLKG